MSFASPPVPIADALAFPLYNDLMLFPRYPGMDADDAAVPFNPAASATATAQSSRPGSTEPESGNSGGNLTALQKRQLGRMRAQGIDVRIPMTEGERVRRTEHQRERKKRRRDEKKQKQKQQQQAEVVAGDKAAANEVDDASTGGPEAMNVDES